MSFHKKIPWRSKPYLKWVSQNERCCICGTTEGVHGHHESFGFMEKPTGGKYPDTQIVPMCDGKCHRERQEYKGPWQEFYFERGVNPWKAQIWTLNRYLVEKGIK